MARKPKAPPSTSVAATLSEKDVSAVIKAFPVARRGRKAKGSAPSPEMPPAVDSDEAMQATPAPGAPAVDGRDTPARGRSGGRPKQPAGAATASLPQDDDAQRQSSGIPSETDDEAGPAPVVDDDLIVEKALSMEGPGRSGAADMDAEPGVPTDTLMQLSYSPETSLVPKPAAGWDRATDTVRFDWPEIERTASQAGPNQGMAKLLIAARAEGANSRWPL